jgi:glutathione S-transferase
MHRFSATIDPASLRPPALPVLYSFRRCPFAMRARLALHVSGQVCELREIDLRNKPPELWQISDKGTVPVLMDTTGEVIAESLEIMLWALNQHDPDAWLQPSRGTLADMTRLIAECDNQFKYHLDHYKYASRYPDSDATRHRDAAALFLEKLNIQLGQTTYLFGSHPALADMAIRPFVRQFALANPDWFSAQSWSDLQAWLATWVDSPLFIQIMQKYATWAPEHLPVFFPATKKAITPY